MAMLLSKGTSSRGVGCRGSRGRGRGGRGGRGRVLFDCLMSNRLYMYV
jgi:hypothetical protein